MFLSNMSGNIIRMADEAKREEVERGFAEKGMLGVSGVIDGVHFTIDKPKTDPDSYYDRDKNYSVQAQIVCDHHKRIRDVFIGYPGSVHDARVYRASPLLQNIAEKCGPNKYLIGDSAYPVGEYLLTPFPQRGNLTPVQVHFNTKLRKVRYLIEHCFGLLKGKFRQLLKLKIRGMKRICHFIRACCVLHNLAIDDEFEDVIEIVDRDEDPQENIDAAPPNRTGDLKRRRVAQFLYANQGQ